MQQQQEQKQEDHIWFKTDDIHQFGDVFAVASELKTNIVASVHNMFRDVKKREKKSLWLTYLV